MIVTTRKLEEVTITDPATSAVTSIVLEDTTAGKGRIIVVGAGQTHTCFWNNMGERTVREFFLLATDDYIAGCLDPFGTAYRKIDPKVLTVSVLKDIEASLTLSDEQKVTLSARTTEFTPISDVNGLHALNGGLMLLIYGPMWTNQVNERFLGQHPQYLALLARIALIRKVLSE